MKRFLTALGVVLLGAFLVGACGDDSGGGDKAAENRIVTSLTDDEEGLAVTKPEAECVAKAMVDAIGADRINKIDFTADTPDLSAKEAASTADAFDKCTDISELVAKTITSGEDVSADSQKCLGDTLDDDEMKSFLETGFSDQDLPDDVLTSIDDAMQQCLTDAEYAAVNG
jgi:hypothetical protein